MRSYTDIEQSKKLAKILPIESADMCWTSFDEKWDAYLGAPNPDAIKKEIPCWSLSALMNILPSEFTEKGEYSETTYNIHIRKYALTDNIDVYQIAYGSYYWHEDGSCTWSDMVNTGEKENLIDAAFQMVIWLKENNKLCLI